MIATAVFSTTIAILLILAHHLGRRFSLLFMMGVVILFAIVCHWNLSHSFSAENSFVGSLYRLILRAMFFLCCMVFFVCAIIGGLELEAFEKSTGGLSLNQSALLSIILLVSFGILGVPTITLFVWSSTTLFAQSTVADDGMDQYLIWAGIFLLNGTILFLLNYVIKSLFVRAIRG
jgi:hypothetical protein